MFWPFWSLLSPSSLLLEEHEEEEDTSVSEVKEFSSLGEGVESASLSLVQEEPPVLSSCSLIKAISISTT